MGANTRRFYYCSTIEGVEEALERGIQPAKAAIIIPQLNFSLGLEGQIMLWKNLGILEGELFRSLELEGYSFLSVDLPLEHPIERDCGGMNSIAKNHTLLGHLILQMKIPFDIRQFMNENELRKLAMDISRLPKQEKARVSFRRVMEKIASNEKILTFVLDSAQEENWDKVVGFYRTSCPIPTTNPYIIQEYNGGLT